MIVVKIHSGSCYFCCFYHPPKPVYKATSFLKYLCATIDHIMSRDGSACLVIARDINPLPEGSLLDMALISAVEEPMHQGHKLGRIYTRLQLYNNCKVVASSLKTAHKDIVARGDNNFINDANKKSASRAFVYTARVTAK